MNRARCAPLGLFALWLAGQNVSAALPEACTELLALLHSGPRDFVAAETLQARCAASRDNSASARLLAIGENLDLAATLAAAHRRRSDARERLLQQASATVAALQGLNAAQAASLNDSQYLTLQNRINELRNSHYRLRQQNFRSHLEGPLLVALQLGSQIELSSAARNLANTLSGRVNGFASRSDSLLQPLDARFASALEQTQAELTRLRAQANDAAARRADDDLLNGVVDEVLRLKASLARERFFTSYKVPEMLLQIRAQLHSGRRSAALAGIEWLDLRHKEFVSRLPERINTALAGAPTENWRQQLLELKSQAQTMSAAQALTRVASYIEFRSNQWQTLRSDCRQSYPSQRTNLTRLDIALAEYSNSIRASSSLELRLFVAESLADRLDTAIDLCRNNPP